MHIALSDTFITRVLYISLELYAHNSIKPCSDERQIDFKSSKLKRCKFLQPSFTTCEHDCFCLKALKHFCFKTVFKNNFFLFLKTVLRTLKTSFKN